ncbi:NifB/NifX family molybdenum-iron cluster-binding protein [bacterium]|nr:NifB/NifX family molybdenum-iron cluster-binding protein [bacterium]
MQENVNRIAIPSAGGGGLAARVDPHFGRCQCFTIVELTDGQPGKILLLDNPPHQDCLQPVQLLADHGVSALVVAGIGMRPLAGFVQAGITVYAGRAETVGELLQQYANGQLQQFDTSQVCGGGHGHG